MISRGDVRTEPRVRVGMSTVSVLHRSLFSPSVVNFLKVAIERWWCKPLLAAQTSYRT